MTSLPTGANVDRASDALEVLGLDPADARRCAEGLAQLGLIEPDEVRLDYVGWGGRMESGVARTPLGSSLVDLAKLPMFGLRRAVWDVCFGVTNGFKWSAILYYVLTRSLSGVVCRRFLEREAQARGWVQAADEDVADPYVTTTEVGGVYGPSW